MSKKETKMVFYVQDDGDSSVGVFPTSIDVTVTMNYEIDEEDREHFEEGIKKLLKETYDYGFKVTVWTQKEYDLLVDQHKQEQEMNWYEG